MIDWSTRISQFSANSLQLGMPSLFLLSLTYILRINKTLTLHQKKRAAVCCKIRWNASVSFRGMQLQQFAAFFHRHTHTQTNETFAPHTSHVWENAKVMKRKVTAGKRGRGRGEMHFLYVAALCSSQTMMQRRGPTFAYNFANKLHSRFCSDRRAFGRVCGKLWAGKSLKWITFVNFTSTIKWTTLYNPTSGGLWSKNSPKANFRWSTIIANKNSLNVLKFNVGSFKTCFM